MTLFGFMCGAVSLLIFLVLLRRNPWWVVGVMVNTVMVTLLGAKLVGLIP